MYIIWLLGRRPEITPSIASTVEDETRAGSAKSREVQERADRAELITKHVFSDLKQANCDF